MVSLFNDLIWFEKKYKVYSEDTNKSIVKLNNVISDAILCYFELNNKVINNKEIEMIKELYSKFNGSEYNIELCYNICTHTNNLLKYDILRLNDKITMVENPIYIPKL